MPIQGGPEPSHHDTQLIREELLPGNLRPPTMAQLVQTALAVLLKSDGREFDLINKPESRPLGLKLISECIAVLEDHSSGLLIEVAHQARGFRAGAIKQPLFTGSMLVDLQVAPLASKPLTEQPAILSLETKLKERLLGIGQRIDGVSARSPFLDDNDMLLQLAEHVLTYFSKKKGGPDALEQERRRGSLGRAAEAAVFLDRELRLSATTELSDLERQALVSHYIESHLTKLISFEKLGIAVTYKRFCSKLAEFKLLADEEVLPAVVARFAQNSTVEPLPFRESLTRLIPGVSESRIMELESRYSHAIGNSERARIEECSHSTTALIWKMAQGEEYKIDHSTKNSHLVVNQCANKESEAWLMKTYRDLKDLIPEHSRALIALSPFAPPRILELFLLTDVRELEIHAPYPFKSTFDPWSPELENLRLRWALGKSIARHWDPGIWSAVEGAQVLLSWELKALGVKPSDIKFEADPETPGAVTCEVEFPREGSAFRYKRKIRYLAKDQERAPAPLSIVSPERPYALLIDDPKAPPLMGFWFDGPTFKIIDGYKTVKGDQRALILSRDKAPVEVLTSKAAVRSDLKKSVMPEAVTSPPPVAPVAEHFEKPRPPAPAVAFVPLPAPQKPVLPRLPNGIMDAAAKIIADAQRFNLFSGSLKSFEEVLRKLARNETPSKSQIRPFLRIGPSLDHTRSSNLLIMRVHDDVKALSAILKDFYASIQSVE